MIYHVTIEGRTLVVELGDEGVTVDGREVGVGLAHVDGGPIRSLLVDGASHRLAAEGGQGGSWRLHLDGRPLEAVVVDERTRAIQALTGNGQRRLGPRPVVAPMPGMVVRVEVAEGDRVTAGQGVVIVEAMKMENELVAEGDGIVSRVHVAKGEAVEKDQLLVELVPAEGSDGATGEPTEVEG